MVVLATELPFAVVGEDVYVSELASNKLMQKMDGNSFNGAWVSNAARRRKKFTVENRQLLMVESMTYLSLDVVLAYCTMMERSKHPEEFRVLGRLRWTPPLCYSSRSRRTRRRPRQHHRCRRRRSSSSIGVVGLATLVHAAAVVDEGSEGTPLDVDAVQPRGPCARFRHMSLRCELASSRKTTFENEKGPPSYMTLFR